MDILLVAWRYLIARPINLVSMSSVMVGLAAIVVVDSVMNGFLGQQRTMIRALAPDVTVERGDLDAAADAYRALLADAPADADAQAGLAQVELLRRTQDLDPAAVRRKAAENPDDVVAQTQASDLDLLGGHVEDAFVRLIDTVRATSDDDRNTAREHLLELFQVIGAGDPRVVRARRALTNALF